MQQTLPGWFKADEIFSSNGEWYFGSPEGLHVGPYCNRTTAKSKSSQVAKRLKTLDNDADRVRFVRKVLHHEWGSVGATLNAPSQAEEIDLAPPPLDPVRRGEKHRRWFRSDRFFQVDSVWFFSTREGIDVGPFNFEAEARKHEQRLVSLLLRTKTPEEACKVIHEYKHRPTETGIVDLRKVARAG